MTSGNKIPVSTTRNNEIPSTPRCQPIPHDVIHSCLETNWNPSSPVSKDANTHRPIAPVNTEVTSAISLVYSGRREDDMRVSTEPTSGISTNNVRTG